MITLDQIQAFSQQIAERFQPDRIILFVYKAVEIRQAVKSPFPLDLMARTAEQVQPRLEMGDFFIQDILRKGRVLHEANHAGTDR
jgi:uncharacterized protein